MNRIVLLSVLGLGLGLAGPSLAAESERPVSDFGTTITTAPLKLTSPLALSDVERRVADQIGVSAGVGYGRYNSLWLRLVSGAFELAGGSYTIQQMSGSAGVNLYFRDFNQGWFTGLGLEYARYTWRMEACVWRMKEHG